MEFEQYTLALLVTNLAGPELTEEERARVQDAHLSYLADLHAAGDLLAVGPLSDPEGELRALSSPR